LRLGHRRLWLLIYPRSKVVRVFVVAKNVEPIRGKVCEALVVTSLEDCGTYSLKDFRKGNFDQPFVLWIN
jgi:hypothetical protein